MVAGPFRVSVHRHLPACAPSGLRCSGCSPWWVEAVTWPPDPVVRGALVVRFNLGLVTWCRRFPAPYVA